MRLVLAFGTFDVFHPGHAAYLHQAASLGDSLVVIIARDTNVLKIKNRLPRQNEAMRRKAVQAFLRQEEISGKAILGLKGNRLAVLKKYQPQVIALGYDQPIDLKLLRKELRLINLDAKIKRLAPCQPEKYKSSYL